MQLPTGVSKQTAALAVAFALTPCVGNPAAGSAPSPAGFGKVPLWFEANQGQTDASVRFMARGGGFSVFLTPSEAVLALRSPKKPGAVDPPDMAPKPTVTEQAVLRLRLTGARPDPRPVGVEELAGRSNYFIGSDPARWRSNIPTYAAVRYSDVYPGVDLMYHARHGELEYDFVVAPGADPRTIQVKVEGAERIELDAAGDLLLRTPVGSIRQRRPFTYQQVGSTRRVIPSRYARVGQQGFAFEVGPYDRDLPLVIDPGLVYSTYLGGSYGDQGWAIAVDEWGHAYVAGMTQSLNFPTFPTPNPVQPAGAGGYADAFVLKLDPAGTGLVYSTYLGGSDDDRALGIAVDSQGATYVTGYTASTNFPTAGPVPSASQGSFEAFVTKLDVSGTVILLSRYLGGNGDDWATSIGVDGQGSPYVTGYTSSANFPTTPPPIVQSTSAGPTSGDAFVTKLEPASFALVYSTYLGGTLSDAGQGIAVDRYGSAYVAGYTRSTKFPLAGPPLQATNAGGMDGFVAKLDSAGATLVYSTYLGGAGDDWSQAISVDRGGQAYVTGTTDSFNFPVAAVKTKYAGGQDAFVSKLDASGLSLVYSRYLGGSGLDNGNGIAVLDETFAHVTGVTSSANFPLAKPIQGTLGGGFDAFVTRLDGSGAGFTFSTYLGGTGGESGRAIAVEERGGAAYVAGFTDSTNFPTAPSTPFQAVSGGGWDAFATKITPAAADLSVTMSGPSSVQRCTSFSYWITVTNNGPDDATKVDLSDALPAGLQPAAVSTTLGYCISGTGTVTCDLSPLAAGASATITIDVVPSNIGYLFNTASVTGRETDLDPGNNTAMALTYVWMPFCWFGSCPSC